MALSCMKCCSREHKTDEIAAHGEFVEVLAIEPKFQKIERERKREEKRERKKERERDSVIC